MWKSIKHSVRDIYLAILAHTSPRRLAAVHFKRILGHKLNWADPQDLNEKINWLKFYGDTSKWPRLADKYAVRSYVEECGLSHLLVNIYGHWNKAEDIDWQALPEQFVMKMNNGSGDTMICKDKSKIDTAAWEQHFRELLKKRFGTKMAEPHYNKISPCIIAEELLDNTMQSIESSSLIDYKVWAFNGKVAYIWACYNRTPHDVTVGVYDLDWNFHPEYSLSTSHYILARKPMPRPKTLDQMIKAASRLSQGFPQMRVDFYEVREKLYFGELTLTSAAGFMDFYTRDFLLKLGQLCDIHK